MKCPGPEEWLAFYGGETTPSAAWGLAAHLQECRPCQDEFDRLTRLGAGIRGALTTPGKESRAPRRRHIFPQPRKSISRWIYPTVVAAALLVTVAGLAFQKKDASVPAPLTLVRATGVREEAPPLPVSKPAPPAPEGSPRVEPPPPPWPSPGSPEPPPLPRVERPPTAPPPPPPPPPGATRAQETAVSIATIERAGVARPLFEGQAVSNRGTVRFPDGTRMELSEKTSIARLSDRGGAGGIGKWVELTGGLLAIEAAHQPAGHAMAIATPQGEARIVGTTLKLVVEPGSTRLEVVEGKVRLSRPGGGAAEVVAGHFAIAAEGVELAARPLPKMVVETLLKFDFEDGRLPKAFDSGTVERGPERAGNRFSIAGAILPGGTAGGHVKLSSDGKGLFAYSEDLVLAFDYWAGDSVSTLDLHVWSRLHQTTFGTTVWDTPPERWTHLAIPLREFVRTEPDRVLHLSPGEAVPNLWIQAGQPGGKLYLDNLELVRMRPPILKKKP